MLRSAPLLDERVRLGMILGVVVGAASVLLPMLSSLAPLIRADLELSRFQIGALATVYFAVGGSVSVLAGRAVDVFGTRRLPSALLVVTAVALTGFALSTSYAMLLVFAVVGGIGLSASNPVTNAVIVNVVRPGERGTVMGLKHAGVPTTGALLSLTLPAAAVAFGWRPVVVAGAVIVLFLAWMVSGVGAGAHRPAERRSGAGFPRGLLWIGGYAVLMGAAGGATTLYIPLYGHEALGLSVTAAGIAAAAAQATAVASRVLWTRMSETSSTVGGPLVVVALCALAAVVPLVAAQELGPVFFWVGAVAVGAGMLGWTPVAMLGAIRLVESEQAGRASGVVVAGFYYGFMLGPAVFGRIVDSSGGYLPAWLAAAAGFAAAAALALVRGRNARRIHVESAPGSDRVAGRLAGS